jgi:C4-dicarboxylate-specific signal transduction histidine kinase
MDEKTLQLQEELAHVDRLSVMGEMAAGLAHEISQPLAAVVNFAQGCVRRLRSGKTKPSELLDALEQISVQAERAGEIIHRIRGFIGKEEPRMTSVDVNAAIREATGLLEFEAREHAVTLNVDLASQLPKVRGNTIQIQQIILNLARNGMEAMSENGSMPRLLTIRSSATKSGAIEIAVHDNQYGVSTESLELLFESFLTTKTGGLGLGLSICRSIVEAHGGRLWVTTDGVNDTAFRFTLPVA